MLNVLLNTIINLKKVQCPITNIVVFDVVTFNRTRASPYCGCKYKLSKISGKYHPDMSEP